MRMNGSVCLVVIYNHRYIANVEKLENLYRGRFSHIYHLMPFYQGGRENVIPVYESSGYFQGHIAQGYSQYFAEKHRHYLFIADDLVLNPMINEGNYAEYFGLGGGRVKSFIPECGFLHEAASWGNTHRAFGWGEGLQMKGLFPTRDKILKRFENLGLAIKPIPAYFAIAPRLRIELLGRENITDIRKTLGHVERGWRGSAFRGKVKVIARLIRKFRAWYLIPRDVVPRVPLVFGYSDICIVSSKHIRQFAHYCGIFASGNLFVEIALPTSLMMCAEPGEIITQGDISSWGKAMWESEEQRRLAEQYGMQLGKLLANWPEGTLYIHPVKLSQWSQ